MILILMVFCHIVDDYYLQGWLANGKQRKWWIENAPDPKYKYDYIVALAMHSFSWAFMVMLPPLIASAFAPSVTWMVVLAVNAIIHGIVDDLKANRGKINLIQDQSIHIAQIVATYFLLAS